MRRIAIILILLGLLILIFMGGFGKGEGLFSYQGAVILGLVQGITEFIPVSSTGHIILCSKILGLDCQTVIGEQGCTVKEAMTIYTIVLQAGAIFAVVLIYWRQIVSILMGFLGRDRDGFIVGRNLLIAFIPAVIVGLLLGNWIKAHLFSPLIVIIGLVVGAFLILGIEKWRKYRDKEIVIYARDVELHQISSKRALTIGLLQCFSLWPGMSRSMMTIIGGYVVGLNPKKAAEFSFLLGLITLSSASTFKAITEGPRMIEVLDIGPVSVGILVAFVSGACAVKWLIGYISRYGLGIFAWYRFVLAIIVYLAIYGL